MRRDSVDVEQIYAEIFREKRNAYEDGMTIQAANAGCPGRRGTTPPDVMKDMSEQAHTEAAGIANTYNYDLALAIRAIRTEVPRANRYTYAKRLGEWEATRDEWKSKQISLWNQMQWQDKATADFLSHNPQVNKGWAQVLPRGKAVCKICQYWVGRGRVELFETQKQEWPAHLNCPHYWDMHYQGKVKCDELWLGAPLQDWWETEIEKELGEKGGPGSGNWGHRGRPGLVGGSGGHGGVDALPTSGNVNVVIGNRQIDGKVETQSNGLTVYTFPKGRLREQDVKDAIELRHPDHPVEVSVVLKTYKAKVWPYLK